MSIEPTTAISIEPTPEQFAALAASEDDGPVQMLNLLRFKDLADGIDGDDALSGAEAYARYGAAVAPFLERVGGRVVVALATVESVIGPVPGEWDMVLVVQYPSRRAFISMITDPDYLAIHQHRAAGLADSRLVACTPITA